MRRLFMLLAAVAITGVGFVGPLPRASACSCAAPAAGQPSPAAVVEGAAVELVEGSEGQPGSDLGGRPSTWSSVWRFAVDSVERGSLSPGDEIVVDIVRGSGAGCGVAVGAVEADARYRVGGSFDDEQGRLYLNLCSDPVLERLGGAPSTDGDGASPSGAGEPTDSTAVARLDENGDGGGLDGRVVGAGVGAAAGAGAGLLALRRRLRGAGGA